MLSLHTHTRLCLYTRPLSCHFHDPASSSKPIFSMKCPMTSSGNETAHSSGYPRHFPTFISDFPDCFPILCTYGILWQWEQQTQRGCGRGNERRECRGGVAQRARGCMDRVKLEGKQDHTGHEHHLALSPRAEGNLWCFKHGHWMTPEGINRNSRPENRSAPRLSVKWNQQKEKQSGADQASVIPTFWRN